MLFTGSWRGSDPGALNTLFATDFDGTLFRSDRTVSPLDIEALNRLRSRGVLTVLATGRSPFSLERALNGIELPFDWLILSSGAGMMGGGAIEANPGLSPSDVASIRAFLEEQGLDYSVQGPFPDSHLLYHGPGHSHPDHCRRREFYNGFVEPVAGFEGPATQFVVYLDKGMADPGEVLVREALGGSYQVIRTTSPLDHSTVWVEIFPRGVNKGAAMLSLASRYGIPRQRTAALGNDWNDRDMLECAGTAFVVQGSPPGLCPGAITVPGPDHQAVSKAAGIWMGMTE